MMTLEQVGRLLIAGSLVRLSGALFGVLWALSAWGVAHEFGALAWAVFFFPGMVFVWAVSRLGDAMVDDAEAGMNAAALIRWAEYWRKRLSVELVRSRNSP